jgi:hypothetical protein
MLDDILIADLPLLTEAPYGTAKVKFSLSLTN